MSAPARSARCACPRRDAAHRESRGRQTTSPRFRCRAPDRASRRPDDRLRDKTPDAEPMTAATGTARPARPRRPMPRPNVAQRASREIQPDATAACAVLHGQRADTQAKMRQFVPAAAPNRHRARLDRRAHRLGRRDGARRQSLVPPGLVRDARDGSGALRVGRRVARRVLPRREDRLHRQPDAARRSDGFELQEDGRLQMSLLGATTAATVRTTSAGRLELHASDVPVLARSRHRADRSATAR